MFKKIDKDPIGLDKKLNSYFYEDESQNIYFDNEGIKPVLCDSCGQHMKVDLEGYFYCANTDCELGRTEN